MVGVLSSHLTLNCKLKDYQGIGISLLTDGDDCVSRCHHQSFVVTVVTVLPFPFSLSMGLCRIHPNVVAMRTQTWVKTWSQHQRFGHTGGCRLTMRGMVSPGGDWLRGAPTACKHRAYRFSLGCARQSLLPQHARPDWRSPVKLMLDAGQTPKSPLHRPYKGSHPQKTDAGVRPISLDWRASSTVLLRSALRALPRYRCVYALQCRHIQTRQHRMVETVRCLSWQ